VARPRAREAGARVIAAATTGNAGTSLACLAASVGMPCVVLVPASAPEAKLSQLLAYGAQVLAVKGNYDAAYDLCVELCRRLGWVNRNTGLNPFTREGKKTCSFEIWEQLGRQAPDRIVVPVGDGNIISGIWKGMTELRALGLVDRLPRLVCAQAASSDAVSRAVRAVRGIQASGAPPTWADVRIEPVQADTIADSLAVDRPRDGLAAVRAVIESRGEALTVTDGEIVAAVAEVATTTGLFVEPAAAVTWACLKRLARNGTLDPAERLVLILTGSGLKNVAAVRAAAPPPTVIEPTLPAALAALQGFTRSAQK
jgi:threonine synthase